MSSALFRLVYWPGLPGRGEPIRLALEQAGIAYDDLALTDQGEAVDTVMRMCGKGFDCPAGNVPPFAPPILEHRSAPGEEPLILSQLPNIMLYLGSLTELAPAGAGQFRVNQVFLTLCDLQNEAVRPGRRFKSLTVRDPNNLLWLTSGALQHDTHHPISVGDYYEDQKVEAHKRSIDFRKARLPKFLSYFDRLPSGSSGKHLVGDELTYADLMLWHVCQGLEFAYPNAMRRLLPQYPGIKRVTDEVAKLDRIKAYAASDRRQKFSDGLFRAYKELDVEADLSDNRT